MVRFGRDVGVGAASSGRRLIGLALLLALGPGCTSPGRHPVKLEPPLPVPELATAEDALRPFRLSEHRGKVVVLSFGYTSCPDVCPTTLLRLQALARALAEDAAQVETVFVSVDPPRDSAERLSAYVTAFDERFHGVRLEGPPLARILAGFGVTARRNELDARRYRNLPAGRSGYSIDHTGGYFLVGPDGRLHYRFPHEAEVPDLLAAVRSLLSKGEAAGARSSIRVEGARARLSPSGVGAIYLRLTNTSHEDDGLVAAEAKGAAFTELHETVREDELMRMVARPEGFDLRAGEAVSLEQGGKHLMLFGLEAESSASSAELELELRFRRAPPLRVKVPAEWLGEGLR